MSSSASATLWPQEHDAALAEECAQALTAGKGSVFGIVGREATQRIVGRLFEALRADLESGQGRKTRQVLSELIGEVSGHGFGFHDLRALANGVRSAVLGRIDGSATELRSRAEDWLFRLVLDASMYFLAYREESFQDQVSSIEVNHLENQLTELKTAYSEKERLLEVVRQASTPIAPVFEGVLVVPLVGIFDALRAQTLTETLLESIVKARAHVVIVDVTGIPVFDTASAQHLISTAKAARLLGAQVILVGISPKVAQTITALDIDLDGVVTKASLQDGLALSLARLRYRIVPMAES